MVTIAIYAGAEIIFSFILSRTKTGRYLHKVCINYTIENIITDFLSKTLIFILLKNQKYFTSFGRFNTNTTFLNF